MKNSKQIFVFLSGIIIYAIFFQPLLSAGNNQTAVAGTTGNLIINELMPNPAGADETGEWIEIKNTGNSVVNLQDWKIDSSILPAGQINPGEIAVLARNSQELQTKYPRITNKIYPAVFTLLNSADTIVITNNYQESGSFSYGQPVEGKSYELLQGSCNLITVHPAGDSLGKENSLCNEQNQPSSTPVVTPLKTITPGILLDNSLQTPGSAKTNANHLNSKQASQDMPSLGIPKIYRLKPTETPKN